MWLAVLLTLAMPLVNLGLLVASIGYFGSYYLTIISETANGNDTMPNWPDLSNVIDGVIKPLARLVAIMVNTWLPFIVVVVLLKYGVRVPRVVWYMALAYGMVSWPMTALLVQLSGRWRAGLPHVVFPAMIEMGWTYVLVALAGLAALLAHTYVLPALFGRTLAGAVVWMAGLIYMLALQARITGMLYRTSRMREQNAGGAAGDGRMAE